MTLAQSRLEIMQVCKLLQCVREQQLDQIEKLTKHGVPNLINFNDPNDGSTALGTAAAMNNESICDFLLKLNAHPDVVDFKGRTPAMRAAENGNLESIEILAGAGANMSILDMEGKGILYYCINSSYRHQCCFDIALYHGADVKSKFITGGNLLLHACETASENENMCLQLLHKGAEANYGHEKTHRSPLMAASESGSVKVCRALLEKNADVNKIDSRRMHAAHFAAMKGHLEVLSCLSGYGADFNVLNIEGNTPIHLAAKFGFAMCCKFLSQRGCNPKTKNSKGDIARNIAKEAEHKAASKELRKAEKSFGKITKNNEPWVILFYDWLTANQPSLFEHLKKLDDNGSGIIPIDDLSGCLCRHNVPIESDNIKQVMSLYGKSGQIDYNDFLSGKKFVNKNYLMSSFAPKKKKKKGKKGGKAKKFKLIMPICTRDLGDRAQDGGPPLTYIDRHIHFTDTGRFDRDKPPEHPVQDDSAWYIHSPDRTYRNINEAARLNDYDSLKDALANGLSMDTRDKYYKTPLMVACVDGNIGMVKFLVENGASVNTQDNFKWTPLHHAAHSGQLDVVEYLINAGAQIEAPALNGGTPLYRAIESSKMDVVKFLIEKGAQLRVENKKGSTPYDTALAWSDLRVLRTVKEKWDSLPPLVDKKKGKDKPKPAPPKSSDKQVTMKVVEVQAKSTNVDIGLQGLPSKSSILRMASAIAGGLHDTEDITYVPLKSWTTQPTTDELIDERVEKREKFTWEVDFDDFKMPFLKNIDGLLKEEEEVT